jgi:N-acetylglutamate synthase-like GNAT family acetyltransferase
VIIRRCSASDVPTIDEIINDAAVAYRGAIAADRWHEPYMSREELEREIAAGVVFSAAVDEQGLVLGVMGLQEVKDVTLIRHAYTRTQAQGRGVGAALLDHLIAQTSRPVLIGTWRAATWAIRFYERHGFEVVDGDEKNRLLRTYWSIPERQVDESVVLRQSASVA